MDRPLCECGNLCKKGNLRFAGSQSYYRTCSPCVKKKNKQGTPGAQGGSARAGMTRFTSPYKKDYCEDCGFIAEHRCQLDVDHIDGDRANNSPDNYKTLCANCHRLKTHKNKDWQNTYHIAETVDIQ